MPILVFPKLNEACSGYQILLFHMLFTNSPSIFLVRLIYFTDTDLTKRFNDQFSPMLINKETSVSSSNSMVIRMPLSSKCRKEEESDCLRVKHIFDRFMHHASSSLLFLKSVLQVINIEDKHFI